MPGTFLMGLLDDTQAFSWRVGYDFLTGVCCFKRGKGSSSPNHDLLPFFSSRFVDMAPRIGKNLAALLAYVHLDLYPARLRAVVADLYARFPPLTSLQSPSTPLCLDSLPPFPLPNTL
jgi:hypothetical protein